jgi:uncharacterized protein
MRWVDRMIIGHNLCPYTAAVRNRAGALACRISTASDEQEFLADLAAEAQSLSDGPAETSLVALAPCSDWAQELHSSFAQFMSLGWVVEDHVQELQLPTELQLALFHPLAVRNLYASGDAEAEDFAMRAPHPTVHLLRTADVQAVPPKSAAAVPERNRVRLRGLGLVSLAAELRALEDEAASSSDQSF